MSDSLTQKKLKWTEDFTNLSLGEATESADPAPTAQATSGDVYDGAGRGANDPDPFNHGKRDILLKRIADGEEVSTDEISDLDNDDKARVLKAITEAEKKQVEALTKLLDLKKTEMDFAKRMLVLKTDPNDAEQSATDSASKLYDAFLAKVEAVDVKKVKAATVDALSADVPPIEAAFKAAEKIRADRPKFEKQSKDAADRLAKMTDKQLDSMSPVDAAKALSDLVAAGKPKGDQFKTLMRLYRHIKLDPAFLKADKSNQQAIVTALKGNPDLKAAKNGWGGMDPDKKIAALQKVADAQAKVYGIPSPKVVRMKAADEAGKDDVVTEAGFQPSDGMIHMNFGTDSSANDFKSALETILHETAHAFQKSLADKFKKGELKPDDPLYAEAALFAANAMTGANINDQDVHSDPADKDLILTSYEAQPNEKHSFETSQAMSKPVLLSL